MLVGTLGVLHRGTSILSACVAPGNICQAFRFEKYNENKVAIGRRKTEEVHYLSSVRQTISLAISKALVPKG